MSIALFSTAYFAPVQYYWLWNHHPDRLVEAHEHFIKQTWRNRCLIATANGPMALSFPVEKGSERKAILDVRISDHGQWQRLHWLGLESAYNSTPFYEYYADDFRPFFERTPGFLLDFNEGIHEKICELIGLSNEHKLTGSYVRNEALPEQFNDFRNEFHPRKNSVSPDEFTAKPYYQVFSQKFGFQGNMSILDLLFNMGPESILYL